SSLIVEGDDVDPVDGLPRATGLLFAGSRFYTVANPIDAVLTQLGVTMVGGTAPDPEPDPDPPAPGAGTITGTVTDNTVDNNRIVGAKIRVDTGQSVKTNADGNYTVTGVPAGTHSVKASAKGFESQTITEIVVVKEATTEVDFELSPRVKGGQGAIRSASNAKARHGKKLLEIPGVAGHGIGLSKKGRPVIQVYLEDDLPEARAQISAAIDGVPVRVLVTGPFEAF
ncbi:MAG: carboxypeptidase-like regulatory domain-containing protein, partial [Planctomycetota bacterium]